MLLPVAAWRYANRNRIETKLPALTASAVLAALPLLAGAALLETYVSPKTLRALTCIGEREGFRGGGACGHEPQECPKLIPAEFDKRYQVRLSQAEIARSRRGCVSAHQH